MTAAVVLNYRTPDATIRAVRSLIASTMPPGRSFVVDNASGDNSPDLIRQKLTGVDLIVASTNGGFSAGCNVGIRAALDGGATRILLMNSDAVMAETTLAALHAALDRDPNIGIVGPIVTTLAGDRVESAGIRYSTLTGRVRLLEYGARVAESRHVEDRDVDSVSGCAMLIRRHVFERVGLLAEEFFFGFEDLDFCLRARAAGFRTVCARAATVLHEGNLSIGRQSSRRIYFATRNHLLLAARAGSDRASRVGVARATSIVGLNLAHVLLTSNVPRGQGLAALVRGISDYRAGRFGNPP